MIRLMSQAVTSLVTNADAESCSLLRNSAPNRKHCFPYGFPMVSHTCGTLRDDTTWTSETSLQMSLTFFLVPDLQHSRCAKNIAFLFCDVFALSPFLSSILSVFLLRPRRDLGAAWRVAVSPPDAKTLFYQWVFNGFGSPLLGLGAVVGGARRPRTPPPRPRGTLRFTKVFQWF